MSMHRPATSQGGSSSSESAGSWGAMIQAIEAEKRRPAFSTSHALLMQPAKVSLWDRKVSERETDPITMTYRNPEKQLLLLNARADKSRQCSERVATIRAQKYDILAHAGGPPRTIDLINEFRAQTAKVTGGGRDRHLISSLAPLAHTNCPMLYDEAYVERNVVLKKRPQILPGSRRDFSLVSNKFFENNHERQVQEYEATKDRLLKKYWDTHNFDIIRVESCDASDEAKYRDSIERSKQTQGQEQLLRIPPSTLYSEGSAYNILNHEVKDPERFRIATKKQSQSDARQKSAGIQENMKLTGQLQYDLQQSRQMNRVSFKRWEKEIDRGYNFLNHSLDVPLPLPRRPATTWERVHGGATSPTAPPAVAHSSSSTSLQARASTALPGSREAAATPGARGDVVPTLDLQKAVKCEAVSYVEPSRNGSKTVNMVRTGGGLH